MDLKKIVNQWFDKWKEGDFLHLRVSENFKHTIPYGTIKGKKNTSILLKQTKRSF